MHLVKLKKLKKERSTKQRLISIPSPKLRKQMKEKHPNQMLREVELMLTLKICKTLMIRAMTLGKALRKTNWAKVGTTPHLHSRAT
jgi:hypothetical protein